MYPGMAASGFVFVLTAVGFSMIIVLNQNLEFNFWLFDIQYLTNEVAYSLLFFSLLLTPVLLWFEKRVFADKAAMIAAEMEQYANLDFRIRPHFLFNSLNQSGFSYSTSFPVQLPQQCRRSDQPKSGPCGKCPV
jgi:hypothetical protein